jgi:hypothetical protein
MLAFLRLGPIRVYLNILNRLAWQQVHTWLACETAWIPQPTKRHAELLGEFLALPGVHANLVADAHLAALEHGRRHSRDRCAADRIRTGKSLMEIMQALRPGTSRRKSVGMFFRIG